MVDFPSGKQVNCSTSHINPSICVNLLSWMFVHAHTRKTSKKREHTTVIHLNEPSDITEKVRKEIEGRLDFMLAPENFTSIVKEWMEEHPFELRKLYKLYGNKHDVLCRELTWKLNQLLEAVAIDNPKRKAMQSRIDDLRSEMNSLDPSNDKDKVKASEIQTNILKCQSTLNNMSVVIVEDKRYKGRDLNLLVNSMRKALAEITVASEPSDIEARRHVKFRKKMPLKNALFSLLYNTRPETIAVSVLNLRAWAWRLKERICIGEVQRENQPTMLIFRSRKNNGERAGNCGKSTICAGCERLFERKNLSVSQKGIQMPTYERVSVGMSDKSLICLDDVNWKNADWEAMNRFCDGIPITNRGKYQKEGNIFPFGNIIATTNYDLTYENNTRYPVIEFTPNQARIVLQNKIVQSYIRYSIDDNGKADYSDAWETLLAYAEQNWMSDYHEFKRDILSRCSCQKTKLDNLIVAYLTVEAIPMNLSSFEGSNITRWIKEKYPSEIKSLNMARVSAALESLGIEQLNDNANDYRRRYKTPPIEFFNDPQQKDEPLAVFDWICENRDKSAKDWRI